MIIIAITQTIMNNTNDNNNADTNDNKNEHNSNHTDTTNNHIIDINNINNKCSCPVSPQHGVVCACSSSQQKVCYFQSVHSVFG